MSNEELCAEGKIPELWENVRPFCIKKAIERMRAMPTGIVELDDLISSSYIAVYNAAQSYSADAEAGFLTWLTYFLLKEYNRCCKFEPVESLDCPLNDETDTLLIDTIPDGRDDIGDAERRMFTEQLHIDLERLMSEIPAQEADIVRKNYFAGMTTAQIAISNGKPENAVKNARAAGLRHLRNRAMRSSKYF